MSASDHFRYGPSWRLTDGPWTPPAKHCLSGGSLLGARFIVAIEDAGRWTSGQKEAECPWQGCGRSTGSPCTIEPARLDPGRTGDVARTRRIRRQTRAIDPQARRIDGQFLTIIFRILTRISAPSPRRSASIGSRVCSIAQARREKTRGRIKALASSVSKTIRSNSIGRCGLRR